MRKDRSDEKRRLLDAVATMGGIQTRADLGQVIAEVGLKAHDHYHWLRTDPDYAKTFATLDQRVVKRGTLMRLAKLHHPCPRCRLTVWTWAERLGRCRVVRCLVCCCASSRAWLNRLRALYLNNEDEAFATFHRLYVATRDLPCNLYPAITALPDPLFKSVATMTHAEIVTAFECVPAGGTTSRYLPRPIAFYPTLQQGLSRRLLREDWIDRLPLVAELAALPKPDQHDYYAMRLKDATDPFARTWANTLAWRRPLLLLYREKPRAAEALWDVFGLMRAMMVDPCTRTIPPGLGITLQQFSGAVLESEANGVGTAPLDYRAWHDMLWRYGSAVHKGQPLGDENRPPWKTPDGT